MSKKFWKVAVYETWESFGGSEEGGWWYEKGDKLKECAKTFFNIDDAIDYKIRFNDKLKSKWGKQYKAREYYRGTPKHYPKYRPHYE